eukprot:4147394-Pleurochrysis_carterae.AAC.1
MLTVAGNVRDCVREKIRVQQLASTNGPGDLFACLLRVRKRIGTMKASFRSSDHETGILRACSRAGKTLCFRGLMVAPASALRQSRLRTETKSPQNLASSSFPGQSRPLIPTAKDAHSDACTQAHRMRRLQRALRCVRACVRDVRA